MNRLQDRTQSQSLLLLARVGSLSLLLASLTLLPAPVPAAGLALPPQLWDQISASLPRPQAEAAVPALVDALRDPDRAVRRDAALALGRLGAAANPAFADLLALVLQDPDPGVREAAMGSMRQVAPRPSALSEGLLESLRHPQAEVRRMAAALLARVGTEADVSGLIQALYDSDTDVQIAATAALGQLGSAARTAVPSLLEGLEERDAEVRRSSLEALYAVGADPGEVASTLASALGSANDGVREDAAAALEELALEELFVLPAIIGALEDPNELVRGTAAQILRSIGPAARGAVPDLIDALRSADVFVRTTAAYALGLIGPDAQAAFPALLEAVLDDPDSDVRLEALAAIGEVMPQATPALGRLFRADDYPREYRYVFVFTNLGPQGVPLLASTLKDGSPTLRSAAAQALEQMGEAAEPAVPALRKAAEEEKDPKVRRAARKALEKLAAEKS